MGKKIGKLYINETQYFDNVPQQVLDFYIGGYQVLYKYLKDRKGRKIMFDEVFSVTGLMLDDGDELISPPAFLFLMLMLFSIILVPGLDRP